MRILLLGATGNLGLRLIPALLAHGHSVTAFVRSAHKLRSLITDDLQSRITIYEGDALDSTVVENALRHGYCEGVMNTAGNRIAGGAEKQILGKIATAVSSAAVRVGKERGTPLRAWFIGGLGSLEYPGTGGWQIQDYMPVWTMIHLRQVEEVMKAVPTTELEWSLLCVAFMKPASSETAIDVLPSPNGHNLAVKVGSSPRWQDSWIRYVPFVGVYLNLIPAIRAHTTMLEDVADLIAEGFDKWRGSEFVGQVVGMKQVGKAKST